MQIEITTYAWEVIRFTERQNTVYAELVFFLLDVLSGQRQPFHFQS